MNKYVEELPEENENFYSLRLNDYRYGETRCDNTEGTINSTMNFTINDGCADRSTEVDSCLRLRRSGILVIQ